MPRRSATTSTRRAFCGSLATASAATLFSAPLILPSRLFGATAPSNRVRVGQIGCGRIARDLEMPGVVNSGLGDLVALCDLDSKRVAEAKVHAESLYAKRNEKAPEITTFGDYRELLARKDIDAVAISTPDHWHAELAIAAALAGKDVYLEKPLSMTLAEGIQLEATIRKAGRILQVGSQHRSRDHFRRGCELVRSGAVGRLRTVEIGMPVDPTGPDEPQQPVPANLNYNAWLGSTPEVYYTEQRVHPQNGYARPGWLRNETYCLGMITGHGAHYFDIAHWGMNMESSGPVKVEGTAEFPTNKIWNVHGPYRIEFTYPGDIRMIVSDKLQTGVRFIGEDGWIFVHAGRGAVTATDPQGKKSKLQPLDASDKKFLAQERVKVELYRSANQHANWLECVRTRKKPVAPVEVGHRSNSACIVGWIGMKLGRPLRWDPAAQRFVGDEAANAMLSRPQRAPFGTNRLVKA